MKESESARQTAFAEYFRLAEKSAKESGQPLRNIIIKDFSYYLLPDLSKLDRPTNYSIQTLCGTFTFDTSTLKATSPFLPNRVSETLLPIESILLETFFRQPTRLFKHVELIDIVDKALDRAPHPRENGIKWHIANLRKKLGIKRDSSNNFPLIVVRKGIGYAFLPESNSEDMSEG